MYPFHEEVQSIGRISVGRYGLPFAIYKTSQHNQSDRRTFETKRDIRLGPTNEYILNAKEFLTYFRML